MAAHPLHPRARTVTVGRRILTIKPFAKYRLPEVNGHARPVLYYFAGLQETGSHAVDWAYLIRRYGDDLIALAILATEDAGLTPREAAAMRPTEIVDVLQRVMQLYARPRHSKGRKP